MSTETKEETTGVDFVLYAAPEERRAVQVVELFLDCVAAAARDAGKKEFSISLLDIHKHVPAFVKNLSLCIGFHAERFYELNEHVCQAVILHGRAYPPDPGTMRVGYDFYLHLPDNLGERKERILKEADAVGVFIEVRNYEHLVGTVSRLLKLT